MRRATASSAGRRWLAARVGPAYVQPGGTPRGVPAAADVRSLLPGSTGRPRPVVPRFLHTLRGPHSSSAALRPRPQPCRAVPASPAARFYAGRGGRPAARARLGGQWRRAGSRAGRPGAGRGRRRPAAADRGGRGGAATLQPARAGGGQGVQLGVGGGEGDGSAVKSDSRRLRHLQPPAARGRRNPAEGASVPGVRPSPGQ